MRKMALWIAILLMGILLLALGIAAAARIAVLVLAMRVLSAEMSMFLPIFFPTPPRPGAILCSQTDRKGERR